jgi:hypothetical protein
VRKIFLLTGLFLLLTAAAYAKDFTVDDFDYPDPSQADTYYQAVDSLIDDLTIVATDADGNQLFTVVPMTMELVALQAQARIHESQETGESVEDIIAQANSDKPSANAFAFMLEGDPGWVRKDVTIDCLLMVYSDSFISMPVVQVSEPVVSEGGSMISGWAFMAENEQQLRDFLAANTVFLSVGDREGGSDVIRLDCGFWRQFGLFDIDEPAADQGSEDIP